MNRWATVAAIVCAFAFGAVVDRGWRSFQPVAVERWDLMPLYQQRAEFFAQSMPKADLVMIGDSLTELAEWPELLPGVNVVNRGISGDNTEALLRRLDAIERLRPKVAAVMIGINDFRILRASVDEVAQRYRAIIDRLRSGGATVLVQSTLFVNSPEALSINTSVAELNRMLAQYCTEGRCDFIDLNIALSNDGRLASEFSMDGLHPNAAAYGKWASLLVRHVKAVQAPMPERP